MLSKKYYVMLADIIAEADISQESKRIIVNKMISKFQEDNERFNKETFIKRALKSYPIPSEREH